MDGSGTMSMRANENEVKKWKGHQRTEDGTEGWCRRMAKKKGYLPMIEEAEERVLANEEAEERVLANEEGRREGVG